MSRRRFAALFVLLVLAIAALSLSREPAAFLSPVLAYEDGRDVFAYYYNHPEPAAIFRSYNGYTALLPNLWGWLVLRGPVEWAPYLLAGGPLLVSSFAFAFFALPLFRPLVPSTRARAGICLVAAAAPLTNDLYLGNTMYSVWSLLLVLVLAALAPTPRSVRGAVAAGFALGLLLWSHPLSLLVVPVFVARALAEERLGFVSQASRRLTRVYHLSLAGLGVAYQLVGVSRESVSPPAWADTLFLTYRFLWERVFFGTVFGDGAARALRKGGHEEWIVGGGWIVLGLLAVALWHLRRRLGRLERGFGFYLGVLIVGLTLLYVVGRSPDLSILGSDRAFRYFWTQRVLFVILLGFVAERWLAGKNRALRLVCLAGVVAGLVLVNRDNRSPYRVRAGQGEAVRAFAAEIATQEAARGGRQGVSARLDRGIWSLEVAR